MAVGIMSGISRSTQPSALSSRGRAGQSGGAVPSAKQIADTASGRRACWARRQPTSAKMAAVKAALAATSFEWSMACHSSSSASLSSSSSLSSSVSKSSSSSPPPSPPPPRRPRLRRSPCIGIDDTPNSTAEGGGGGASDEAEPSQAPPPGGRRTPRPRLGARAQPSTRASERDVAESGMVVARLWGVGNDGLAGNHALFSSGPRRCHRLSEPLQSLASRATATSRERR
mmetsp:Transcript_19341/g.44757  ORF Transcript_19341/g.44757 Transcript_19341/m.44757 type:complete len:229 (-) Transcript_19341:103-789(-)